MAQQRGLLHLEMMGQTQLLAGMSRFGEYLESSRVDAFKDVEKYFNAYFRNRFAMSGPGWAPLSPHYAAWKAHAAPGRPILVLTGAMRDKLTGSSNEIAQDHYYHGVGIPKYSWYHQYGTRRMPKREIINFTQPQRTEIVKIFQRWAVKGARDAKLQMTAKGVSL